MSKSNLEGNKIFAALLVAGIAASTSGFIATQVFHGHDLEEDAYPIEGVEIVAGGVEGPTGPEPIMALISPDLVEKGGKIFKQCATCHNAESGAANKIGPNLWATLGKDIAGDPSFSYSDALVSKEGTWDYDKLNHFLYKPKEYAPGTKMTFIGIKKAEDRAAMISWLRAQGSGAYPLPSEAQIAAEEAALAPPEEEAPADEAAEEDAVQETESTATPAEG